METKKKVAREDRRIGGATDFWLGQRIGSP